MSPGFLVAVMITILATLGAILYLAVYFQGLPLSPPSSSSENDGSS